MEFFRPSLPGWPHHVRDMNVKCSCLIFVHVGIQMRQQIRVIANRKGGDKLNPNRFRGFEKKKPWPSSAG